MIKLRWIGKELVLGKYKPKTRKLWSDQYLKDFVTSDEKLCRTLDELRLSFRVEPFGETIKRLGEAGLAGARSGDELKKAMIGLSKAASFGLNDFRLASIPYPRIDFLLDYNVRIKNDKTED